MSMNPKGRSAIVAGGAGGLGSAAVRRPVGVGIGVVVIDPDAERSEELRSELGDSVRTILGTAEEDQVVSEAITVAQSLGIFSIAVSATGVLIRSPRLVDDEGTPISKDILKANLDVHVVGPVQSGPLVGAAFASNVPDEDGQRGVIVQTVSISAFDGQETMVPYAAAKGAIESMTLPMARDLAPNRSPGVWDRTRLVSHAVDVVTLRSKSAPRGISFPCGWVIRISRPASSRPSSGYPYMNAEVIRLDAGARLSIAMGPRSV